MAAFTGAEKRCGEVSRSLSRPRIGFVPKLPAKEINPLPLPVKLLTLSLSTTRTG
jgi:hypothetical protein